MVRRAHFELSVRHLKTFLLEAADENWISVTHYGSRHAMELDNILHKLFSYALSNIAMGQGDEVS